MSRVLILGAGGQIARHVSRRSRFTDAARRHVANRPLDAERSISGCGASGIRTLAAVRRCSIPMSFSEAKSSCMQKRAAAARRVKRRKAKEPDGHGTPPWLNCVNRSHPPHGSIAASPLFVAAAPWADCHRVITRLWGLRTRPRNTTINLRQIPRCSR